jgi:hypothetical protein
MATFTLTEVAADHGTIVAFNGTDEDGTAVVVYADHRPAADIVAALISGPVEAEAPGYAVRYHEPQKR